MKIFVSGSCEAQNVFSLIDPTVFSEAEFEAHALLALQCVYPEYYCVPFRGAFEFDGIIHEADLALIHKDFSHWFVLEVELVSHSLHNHVIPQVRCFQYGKPQRSCIDYLCRYLPNFIPERAESLLRFVPYSVAVVANRAQSEWENALRGVETQFMTLSVFRRNDGAIAHETEGSLYVAKQSLGFFKYSAPDRSIRMDLSCGLPEGILQMRDPFGNVGLWTAMRTTDALWVTKNAGDPGLPPGGLLQVLKTQGGEITIRIPGAM